MISQHSSPLFHYWCGRYPDKVGWLIGPDAWKKKKLRPWIKYACDNDAFRAYSTGAAWDESAYFEMIRKVEKEPQQPLWILVPDVVADRDGTLAKWEKYFPILQRTGIKLGIAVQDGMAPGDIPTEAGIVFVGGSTSWKWRSLPTWAKHFPDKIHVGRVNSLHRLWRCQDLGALSVDGTGWFREGETSSKLQRLEVFLSGHRRQIELI